MKIDYIISVVCVAWIVVDAIIADSLFEANHTLAKWLQGGQKSTSSPRFMIFNIITQFGYSQIVGGLIAIGFLFFANKIQALKVLLYTLFSSYLLSLLKLIYHEPRPYFVYSDLQGIGCDSEFGKPSGHAMVTLVLYYLLFDSFVNRKFFDFSNSINFLSGKRDAGNIELVEVVIIKKDEQGNEIIQNEKSQIDRFTCSKIYFTVYILWIFLIGFSRVMLGAHSFSQVILGWCYGCLCMVVYRLKIDKIFENVLLTITHKGFTDHKHFYKYVLVMVLAYSVLVGSNLLAYNLVDQKITQQERITYANNIRDKSYCAKTFSTTNYTFLADKCMMDSTVLSIIFGVLLTITFTKGSYNPHTWVENYKKLPHLHKNYSFYFGNINLHTLSDKIIQNWFKNKRMNE